MMERTLRFGSAGQLLGTLTSASVEADRSPGLGLVLLNAGIVHRVGPHRINVKLARHAATLGVPSIRFDLSGRGDSGPGLRRLSYKEQSVQDIRDAVTTLARMEGTTHVMVFGICSGADDGFSAALVEESIVSVVMFDPYIFPTLRWRLRAFRSKLRKFGVIGAISRAKSMWKVYREDLEADASNNFGRERQSLAAFGQSLGALVDRGVSVHLVYSGSTCDQVDFESQRRKIVDANGLCDRVHTELLPAVDHVVTTLGAQQILLERLPDWISKVPTRGAAAKRSALLPPRAAGPLQDTGDSSVGPDSERGLLA